MQQSPISITPSPSTPPTLLRYDLDAAVTAFSTTRIAPAGLWGDKDLPHYKGDEAAYAAFNVTDYCGDRPERVAQCRKWLCDELHITTEGLWLPHQVHSARVTQVDKPLAALDTAARRKALDGTDALITDLGGICIGISTADCVPVLLYDSARHAIAAIHSGWRGTVQGIIPTTVRAMTEAYGTQPETLHAVIGPAISLEAFEVGDEVVEQFVAAGFPATVISRAYGPKAHIDLPAACAWQLMEAGVPLEGIAASGLCTWSHSDLLFSARRLGIRSGRIYTGIILRD